MAKTKKVTDKPRKLSLISKIVKRKSLKRSAALTPKLKKLSLALAKAEVEDKIPKLSVSDEESSGSNSETEEIDAPFEVASPKHLLAPPEDLVNLQQVEAGVVALFEYIEKNHDKNTELFDDEQPIFLQITSLKVPKTPNRQIRLTLKHSLLPDSSEICLIVKDEGKAKDHDSTIEHYEELLKDKDITNIKTIMPYHQFKTEYGNQYELVRKLLGLYDYFLVDGRIAGYVTHRLGKIFLDKRKMPSPVKMDATNLKEHFAISLRKTIMKLHAKSDYYIVQVGHTKMSQTEVFENISQIIDELEHEFPGGIDNIRSLGVKTDKSISVPIYLSLKNKSTVDVPVTLAKRPKQFQKVTGELTTFLDKDVTVLPTGEIVVTKQEIDLEDEDFESDGEELGGSDFEDEVVEDEENPSGGSDGENAEEDDEKLIEKVKETPDEVEDEEEGGGILDQAEEIYLNQYEQEHVTTRKTKKTKQVVSENDEVPTKRPKRAVKEPKEKVVQELKKATQKKGKQSKKQEDTKEEETQTLVNTRTMRANKTKPDKEIPTKSTKKPTKKEAALVEETLKITKSKASTKKGKKEEKPEIIEQETKQAKSKSKKQKGPIKTNENGDVPDQQETKPNRTRKTKATNTEVVIPVKKTKANTKTIEEEKPTKNKGKQPKATVETEDKTENLTKSRKKQPAVSNQEIIETKVKKATKQKEVKPVASKRNTKKADEEVAVPVNQNPVVKKSKKNVEVQTKKGEDQKIKSPTLKVKKVKK